MFNLEYAKNFQWTNPEHTAFDCVVKWVEFNEEHNYGCFQSDAYAHAIDLWGRATAGEFGEIAEYIDSMDATEPQPQVIGAQTL